MTEKPHVMVVEARFYADIADELCRGAIAVLETAGASFERVAVPGALELPAAIDYAVRSMDFVPGRRRFDAYVALGCVIRGETSHYDVVCRESARGLQDLTLRYALAMGFGLLTVESSEQAWERAGVARGNKGGDTASAALHMLDLKRRFKLFPR